MQAAGYIDPNNKTFDILGVNETSSSISVVNGALRLTYTSEDGKLVQLVKPLTTSDAISIGDSIGLSAVKENGTGGYAQKTSQKRIAKALTTVDWADTSNLTTKSFVDGNGVTRTAVLLPVVMALD